MASPLDQPPVAPSTTERELSVSRWEPDDAVALVESTVGALLADRAERHPDRLALVGSRHGDGTEVRLSYGALFEEARAVAAALARVAEPGDHVALWAPNVAEWPVIDYGAALAGVVLVALNPVLRPDELAYALTLSRASVLLHAERSRDYDLADVVSHVRGDLPGLRETIGLGETDRWHATPTGAGDRAEQRAERPVPGIGTVLVGAATVPGTMIEAVEQTFGASVHNLFGQTELSPVLSLTRRGDTREDLVTTVGRPLPRTGAAVLDPAVVSEATPAGRQVHHSDGASHRTGPPP